MNEIDVNWRDIQEDESIFKKENKNRAILIRTNVCPIYPRVTTAKYVDILHNRDYSCEETVLFYAFLT